MKEIIADLPGGDEQKAKLDKAADTWRLPYWDWTTERVPKAVRIPKMNIVTPEIRVEEHIGILENPLRKFTNPVGIPMGHEDMKQRKIPCHDDPPHSRYPV